MVSDILNIVFICDDNYALPTRVALNSLIATQKKQLHVKIVCVDLSTYNVHRFKQLATDNTKIDIIETTNLYKDFGIEHSYVSKAALFKFALPNLINEDKVLYLDGDIIVKEDISDFYNTNISNYYAAVIKDMAGTVLGKHNEKLFHKDYFNSGVMLLNLKKMKEDDITNKLFEAKKNDKFKHFMDQDALNQVFAENVIYMSPKYNFMESNLKSFSNIEIAEFYDVSEDDLSNPSIIHLTNSIKPWNNLDAINSDLFFSYLTHSDIFPCLKKYIENERTYYNNIINNLNNELNKAINNNVKDVYNVISQDKQMYLELKKEYLELKESLNVLETKFKNRSFRPRFKKFLKSLFFSQKGNKLKYKVLGLPLLSQKLCTNKYVFRFLGFKFSFKKTKRNI